MCLFIIAVRSAPSKPQLPDATQPGRAGCSTEAHHGTQVRVPRGASAFPSICQCGTGCLDRAGRNGRLYRSVQQRGKFGIHATTARRNGEGSRYSVSCVIIFNVSGVLFMNIKSIVITLHSCEEAVNKRL